MRVPLDLGLVVKQLTWSELDTLIRMCETERRKLASLCLTEEEHKIARKSAVKAVRMLAERTGISVPQAQDLVAFFLKTDEDVQSYYGP